MPNHSISYAGFSGGSMGSTSDWPESAWVHSELVVVRV